MLRKIEQLLTFGINVSFIRYTNMFILKVQKDNKIEKTVLPFDHLTEEKIIKYLDLMVDQLNK